MGIETEYGITLPGFGDANPTTLSTYVVNGYAKIALHESLLRTRWDYYTEMPLRDARGFDMSMADADPSMLTNLDGEFANVVLTNGARLYVDHAHPEYSAPETMSPLDAALYDAAGVLVMERAAAAVGLIGERSSMQLYKNNSDNKGASYGTHENMLVKRSVPFTDIVTHLTPFFITRQLFTGAGRLGLGQIGDTPGYQITQRADYFEAEVGLETTMRRPIINTRDEPHADPKEWRRLHVITGDANLSHFATWLKVGTLAIMLSMIEEGVDLPQFDIEDPVIEMRAVSHDIELRRGIRLVGGRTITALEIQRAYVAAARAQLTDDVDDETRELIEAWDAVIEDLAIDPQRCADRLDWVAKLQVIEAYRQREQLPWDAARLQLVDLQYADVRASKGLAQLMMARGSMRRLFSDAEVEQAMYEPPRDTRAYFRGEVIARYPENIAAASWDSVVFDLLDGGSLKRVPLLDPFRGTAALTEDLLERSPNATALLDNLNQN